MRIVERVTIVVLLGVIAFLLRDRAKTPAPAPEPPRATAAVPVKEEPVREVKPPEAAPEAGKKPALTDAEQKAIEEMLAQDPGKSAEEKEFEKLLAAANEAIGVQGIEGLLSLPPPHQQGSGNDEDLWRLVRAYATETDPARLWALAQRIRFHMTDPRGTVWTIDTEAVEELEGIARKDPSPPKRAIALDAVASTGWGNGSLAKHLLGSDADVGVRSKAAERLRRPEPQESDEVRFRLAEAFRALLRDVSPVVRARAATGFGPWAYRDDDVDALAAIVRDDRDLTVRLRSVGALGLSPVLRARELLVEMAKDPSLPVEVREAAKSTMGVSK